MAKRATIDVASAADTIDAWHDQTSFGWIPLAAMFAAPYERPVSQTRLAGILREWDLRAVGVLYLAERKSSKANEPNTYAILDGRHRVAGASQKGIEVLPALIYHGLTYAEEAMLYVKFATVNRQTALDRFRARLEAQEPLAMEIASLIRNQAGLAIATHSTAGTTGYFNAVFSAERIVNEMGMDILRESLQALDAAWSHQTRAFLGPVVAGMAHFLVRYHDVPGFDRERLVRQLALRTPEQLTARAHFLAASTRGMDARSMIGQTIREFYNEGLRGGNLLPDWQSRVFVRTPYDGAVVFDRSEMVG